MTGNTIDSAHRGIDSGNSILSPTLPRQLTPEADAFLRDLLEGQPLFAFIQDAELRYIWVCNPSGAWTNYHFVGQNQDDLPVYTSDHLTLLRRKKEEVLRTGISTTFEEMRPLHNGTHVITQVTYSRYDFGDGTYGIFGRLLDLSRVRNANEALVEMHKRLHAKVRQLQDLENRFQMAMSAELQTIYTVNEEGRYTWLYNPVNPWEESDIVGKTDEELGLGEQAIQELATARRKALETGEDQELNQWIPTPTGGRVFLRTRLRRFVQPDGSRQLIASVLDLTSQKLLEEKLVDRNNLLAESEQRFNLALADENLAIYIADEEGRYIWLHVSNSIPVLGNVIGKTDLELGLDPEEAKVLYDAKQKVIATKTPYEYSRWFNLPQVDKPVYRRIRLQPIQLADGKTGVLGKNLDMTAQKELEDSLRQLNNQLTTSKLDDKLAQMQLERLTSDSAAGVSAIERLTGEAADQATLFKELVEQNREARAQLAAAREMQRSMLPKGVNIPAAYELAASMESSIEVGGDYYDYLPLGPDGIVIAVGDATGHGVKAGMLVVAVRSYFQLMATTLSLAKMMAAINAGVRNMQMHRTYMGLSVLCIRGKKLSYASGGMPPMMLWRKETGKVETHLIKGLFLGTDMPQTYRVHEIQLEEGDMVVCMSDGFYEARDPQGRMISALTLMDAIAMGAEESPEAVIHSLKGVRRRHTQTDQLDDDATCLALRIH